MNGDSDPRAVARECFVDRVIHDLEDTVMETPFIGVANIHVRTLPDPFQPLQLLDFRGIVSVVICLGRV